MLEFFVFLFNSVDIEDQIKRNKQPKIYSRELIDEFMEKRQIAEIEKKKRILNEIFKFPDELLKIVDELPPSLKPIDPSILNSNFELNFFGS